MQGDDDLIIPRENWRAAAPTRAQATLTYPVPTIYLHHEGGGLWTSLDIEQERLKMRALQADMQSRGYSDFAYGVAVFPSGRAWEGHDLGWVDGGHDAMGSATFTQNANTIAILWPGNYMIQAPSAKQIKRTAEVIQLAQLAGRAIKLVQILGHQQAPNNSSACPGVFAMNALPAVRALVAVPSTPKPPAPVPPSNEARRSVTTIALPPGPKTQKGRVPTATPDFGRNGVLLENGARLDVPRQTIRDGVTFWKPAALVPGCTLHDITDLRPEANQIAAVYRHTSGDTLTYIAPIKEG